MFYPGDLYMLERSILWFSKPDWTQWKMSEFLVKEGLDLPLHLSELGQHHWKGSDLQMCGDEVRLTVSSQPYQRHPWACFVFTWPSFGLCHRSAYMNCREWGGEWLIASGEEGSRDVSEATTVAGSGNAGRTVKRISEWLLNRMGTLWAPELWDKSFNLERNERIN